MPQLRRNFCGSLRRILHHWLTLIYAHYAYYTRYASFHFHSFSAVRGRNAPKLLSWPSVAELATVKQLVAEPSAEQLKFQSRWQVELMVAEPSADQFQLQAAIPQLTASQSEIYLRQ